MFFYGFFYLTFWNHFSLGVNNGSEKIFYIILNKQALSRKVRVVTFDFYGMNILKLNLTCSGANIFLLRVPIHQR